MSSENNQEIKNKLIKSAFSANEDLKELIISSHTPFREDVKSICFKTISIAGDLYIGVGEGIFEYVKSQKEKWLMVADELKKNLDDIGVDYDFWQGRLYRSHCNVNLGLLLIAKILTFNSVRVNKEDEIILLKKPDLFYKVMNGTTVDFYPNRLMTHYEIGRLLDNATFTFDRFDPDFFITQLRESGIPTNFN